MSDPDAITAALERVDFSAVTIADLARLVQTVESHWPLSKLHKITNRHRSELLDRLHYASEPIYQQPDDPAPIGPVLEVLECVDFDAFTPCHVDQIGKALFSFGTVATWQNFAQLSGPNAPADAPS